MKPANLKWLERLEKEYLDTDKRHRDEVAKDLERVRRYSKNDLAGLSRRKEQGK
jgi:hypothetical protein